MFRVEYVYTSDPLVDLIRRSPQEIFRRPYAGYLIFLFGKADARVANWIRDELISLDSLTGPDIAGVVFAKRVTIPVTVMYKESPGPRSSIDHYRGTVDLNDIKVGPGHYPEYYVAKPMVDHGGLQWDDSVQELEAVTYAADEIARAFGVLSNLPCLIVADAVPTKEVEVIPLGGTMLSRIIPLLRNAIGNFLECSNVSGLLVHLRALERLSDPHEKLRARLSDAELQLKRRVESIDNDVARLTRARWYLVNGSERHFGPTLMSVSALPEHSCRDAILRMRSNANALNKHSKTINSLSWYIENAEWPLNNENKERIDVILQRHVAPLLGGCIHLDGTYDRGIVIAVRSKLTELHTSLADGVWGDLPTVDEIRSIQMDGEREVSRLNAELLRIENEAASLVTRILTTPPSFQQFVASAMRQERLTGIKRRFSKLAVEFLAFFLRPPAGPLFARDVYIAENVGAMGPGAVASGLTFSTDTAANRTNITENLDEQR